jgi:hypothetical protein
VAVAGTDLLTAGLPLRGLGDGEWLSDRPACLKAVTEAEIPFIWRSRKIQYLESPETAAFGSRAERQRRWEWDTLKPNVGAAFGAPYAEGYDAAIPSSWQALRRASSGDLGRTLDLIGAGLLVAAPGELPVDRFPLRRRYPDLGVEVRVNPGALPYAFSVGQVLAAPDAPAAAARVASRDFPLREVAVFEGEVQTGVLEPSPRKVRVTERRAGKIELETDYFKPGYLVIMESYDPGWQASVDGIDKKIHRADAAYMGLPIDEGEHTVRFVYRPFGQMVAFAVSLFTALLVAAGLISWWRNWRR